MQDRLGVDPARSSADLIQISRSANIEILQIRRPPTADVSEDSDWAGHHITFYVTDIARAIRYMASRGVQKFSRSPRRMVRPQPSINYRRRSGRTSS
jgi:hypothetical protein